MPYFKIGFLSLRADKIKDTVYSLKVLTKKNGKLSLTINGVGKSKSRFSRLISPGYLCSGVVYVKREHGNMILNNVDIINSFSEKKKYLFDLNGMAYITNFLSEVLPEKMNIPGMFELTVKYLLLENCFSFSKILLFEFYVLLKLGYLPELKCMFCEQDWKNSDLYFDIEDNNIVCNQCKNKVSHRNIKLDYEFIKFYNSKFNLFYKNIILFDEKLTDSIQKDIEKFLEIFIINLNKKLIDSFKILKQIRLN